MSTFSEKVSRLREKGLKVKEIAEKLGVSRQFLNELVKGSAHVPVDKCKAIDNLLAEIDSATPDDVNQCQAGSFEERTTAALADVTQRMSHVEQLLVEVLAKLSSK